MICEYHYKRCRATTHLHTYSNARERYKSLTYSYHRSSIMGHDKNHFVSFPVTSLRYPLLCPVCCMVTEEAVSFRECKHVMCQECVAISCPRLQISTDECPVCGVTVDNVYPDHAVRDVIEYMDVICLNDDPGEGGSQDISEMERCNWTGKCGELREHQRVCQFRRLVCCGCSQKVTKRHMDDHLYHCSYEVDHRIDPNDDYDYGKHDGFPKQISLHGCGVHALNGRYRKHLCTPGHGRYFKWTYYNGSVRQAVLIRGRDAYWYILIVNIHSTRDLEDPNRIVFYRSSEVDRYTSKLPSVSTEWVLMSQHAAVAAPRVRHIEEDSTSSSEDSESIDDEWGCSF